MGRWGWDAASRPRGATAGPSPALQQSQGAVGGERRGGYSRGVRRSRCPRRPQLPHTPLTAPRPGLGSGTLTTRPAAGVSPQCLVRPGPTASPWAPSRAPGGADPLAPSPLPSASPGLWAELREEQAHLGSAQRHEVAAAAPCARGQGLSGPLPACRPPASATSAPPYPPGPGPQCRLRCACAGHPRPQGRCTGMLCTYCKKQLFESCCFWVLFSSRPPALPPFPARGMPGSAALPDASQVGSLLFQRSPHEAAGPGCCRVTPWPGPPR